MDNNAQNEQWEHLEQYPHMPIDRILVGDNVDRVRDLQGLMDSISKCGINTPVRVQKGTNRLIAGRRVLEACRALRWSNVPVIMVACDDDEAELRRIDDNLYHLNLTVLEQGEHLIRREQILAEQGKRAPSHRPKKGANVADLLTTADTARDLNMSARTSQERKQIVKNIPEELRNRIRTTPVANHSKGLKSLSRLPKEEQAKVIDGYSREVEKKDLEAIPLTDAVAIRILQKEIGLLKRNSRISDKVRASYVGLHEIRGRYSVVYADPPWQYQKNGDPVGGTSPENHYETMALGDICSLPLNKITTDDAVLFMWVTRSHLPQGLEVMKKWGFTYKSNMIWVKDKIGTGTYSRDNAEQLLIGTKGQLPKPPPERLDGAAIYAARGRHAEKPEKFAEIIETYYHDYQKIELFGRKRRPFWQVWGNEVTPVDDEDLRIEYQRSYQAMLDSDITAVSWWGIEMIPPATRAAWERERAV